MQYLYKLAKKILTIIYSKGMVDSMIRQYGKWCITSKVLKIVGTNKYRPIFKVATNAFVSRSIMRDKSLKLQYLANRYISALLRYLYLAVSRTKFNNHCYINVYTILLTAKDASPKFKEYRDNKHRYHSGTFWVDKKSKTPSIQGLSKVQSLLNNQLRKYNNIHYIFHKSENPHHTHKHIYSHPHFHSQLLITGDTTHSLLVADKVHNLLVKDFVKVFGYKPVLANVKPLYKKIKKNKEKPVVFKPNQNNKDNYDAVDRFIDYVLHDYRLQLKDSDNFAFSKKLNIKQKRLTYIADIDSGKRTRVVNSINNRQVSKVETKLTDLINWLNQQIRLTLNENQAQLKQKLNGSAPNKKSLVELSIQQLLTKHFKHQNGLEANFGANDRTEMINLLPKENKLIVLTYIHFSSLSVALSPLIKTAYQLQLGRNKPT